jgi:hypothetical protein
MNLRSRSFFQELKDEGEVLASWGEAKLLKYLTGNVELRGGSKEDRIAARKWIAMFMPKAVVREELSRYSAKGAIHP